jgi:tellurite methyltransferase
MRKMKDATHWNKNYKGARNFATPSQFAAFTLNEISDVNTIIEFGCGDGRDTLFFSRQGIDVYASDGSTSAVEICRKLSAVNTTVSCEVVDYSDLELITTWIRRVQLDFSSSIIYARFLLHSVDSETENNLLHTFSELFKSGTKNAFLEFRTDLDSDLPKETPGHFRRFINLQEFEEKLLRYELGISYKREGQGFAKYGSDDAYVARYILKYDK